MRFATFSAVCALCALVTVQAQTYSVAGPCQTQTVDFGTIRMPRSTGCTTTTQCSVKVKVTAPSANCAVLLITAAPVVVFFNAFQASSSQYSGYAVRLATYGYAVVQYDLSASLFQAVTDRVELLYMNFILDRIATSTAAPTHKLHGVLDFTKIAVAGHSRGGKLAALQLANNTRVITAYLIDPVDNTRFSPEGPNYPSAVEALQQAADAGSPKRAGITGAGVTGLCNPASANYVQFYNALGAGTWQQVLPNAGHVAFSGGLGALLCGGSGSMSPSTAIDLSAAPLTAWMESQLRNKTLPGGQFQTWLDAQQAAGTMTFTIKP